MCRGRERGEATGRAESPALGGGPHRCTSSRLPFARLGVYFQQLTGDPSNGIDLFDRIVIQFFLSFFFRIFRTSGSLSTDFTLLFILLFLHLLNVNPFSLSFLIEKRWLSLQL